MKKVLLSLIFLLVFSSISFAAGDLPLKFEVGTGISGAIVNLNDNFTEEEKAALGFLSFLATTRVSVLGNVSYQINDYFAVGGELEAGYMKVTFDDTEYYIVHLPMRAFGRVHLGSLALDPYVGINNMVNSFFSPTRLSNTLEYGVKLHLGSFYIQYGKEKDLQNTIFDTKLTYTRIGAGYQFSFF